MTSLRHLVPVSCELGQACVGQRVLGELEEECFGDRSNVHPGSEAGQDVVLRLHASRDDLRVVSVVVLQDQHRL